MTAYLTPTSDFVDHADSLKAACADLLGQPLTSLSTDPNEAVGSGQTITASNCAQIPLMAQAVELRQPPVQCAFVKMLAPGEL